MKNKKIEIDKDELFEIQLQNKRLINENQELKDKIISLDEKRLKKESEENAIKLTELYLHQAFKQLFLSLGFNDCGTGVYDPVLSKQDNLKHWLGCDWWDYKNIPGKELKIELGACMSENFKKAFLRLWIDTSLNENIEKKQNIE